MYTLMHGFYKYLVQKDEYCVLILGLDDAGKTVSVLTQFNFRKITFCHNFNGLNFLQRPIWKRPKPD